MGLSPRGRGNLGYGNEGQRRTGSIPAWTGEPPDTASTSAEPWVYPRVDGGTFITDWETLRDFGLSPRGRGNPVHCHGLASQLRSIPAWTGEPPPGIVITRGMGVYPRVDGGTHIHDPSDHSAAGLSPRGRGEPSQGLLSPCQATVYPRVDGGTTSPRTLGRPCHGLSPRGRGNLQESPRQLALCRSIPAWTGEPCPVDTSALLRRVYPRVDGGTAGMANPVSQAPGLSPRGRGNRHYSRGGAAIRGSIPAWTGEPGAAEATEERCTVYPRVDGGTAHGHDDLGLH